MGEDIRINLMTISDSVVIVIEEPSDLGAVREFCLAHLLRNIHGLAWWYIDSRIPLQGARIPLPGVSRHSKKSLIWNYGIAVDSTG